MANKQGSQPSKSYINNLDWSITSLIKATSAFAVIAAVAYSNHDFWPDFQGTDIKYLNQAKLAFLAPKPKKDSVRESTVPSIIAGELWRKTGAVVLAVRRPG